MSDNKMLQAILDGQKAIWEYIGETNKDIKKDIRKLTKLVMANGRRIDKLGLNIAQLEDDAPTIEDHLKLEKRVAVLEKN